MPGVQQPKARRRRPAEADLIQLAPDDYRSNSNQNLIHETRRDEAKELRDLDRHGAVPDQGGRAPGSTSESAPLARRSGRAAQHIITDL